jgi:aminoglycoside phosphotransferase (APT) family kinase protein
MQNFSNILIDAELVRCLVAGQFPQWVGLEVKPVACSGWDNRTFHLGDQMSVRLPSAQAYASQVEKEQYWLPRLAPQLSLLISVPLAIGKPAEGYPFSWSIYKWLPGEIASMARITDLSAFATALGTFLVSLQCIDITDGPIAGKHNFYRGGLLATYDAEVRRALTVLNDQIDVGVVMAMWEEALASSWQAPPVWVHGDVALGNLLVLDGRLSAVIDFGCLGVGDPACDLVIAWTLFRGKSRKAFRVALQLDDATWTRACGWALWKALIICAGFTSKNVAEIAEAKEVIAELQADYCRQKTLR